MTTFGILCLSFVITVVAFIIVVWRCINGNPIKFDLTEYMNDIYEAPPMPETKPCPDFKPPAAKPKKIGDLEPNLCPNCGASFDPSTLHCEYCDTWFREKEIKPTICMDANGITINGSSNCIEVRSGRGNAPLARYEYEKSITINAEDAIQNFAKVAHDYGINLKT